MESNKTDEFSKKNLSAFTIQNGWKAYLIRKELRERETQGHCKR